MGNNEQGYIYDKNILAFNSGGGSGFEKLVEASRQGILQANIATLITNNLNYPCVERAKRLGIPYKLLTNFTAAGYQQIIDEVQQELGKAIDLNALSGRLKFVQGLDPTKTINIHPGPLYPGTEHHFGGKRMYGHHVHEAVIQAFREGKLTHSEITMHFVNDRYDEGSVFFRYPVSIFPDDTAETLGQRVNQAEHKRQPKMTDLVVQGEIALQSNGSLKLPQGYDFHLSKVFSEKN